jgi:hypothetical protein
VQLTASTPRAVSLGRRADHLPYRCGPLVC